ncbi:MAG: hypothetical protein ACREEB_11155 [Caulobacteraceae bacterium]
MSPHVIPLLFSTPLDLQHAVIALMIGIASGFFIAELRLQPLRRLIRRKAPRPPTPGDGPWG